MRVRLFPFQIGGSNTQTAPLSATFGHMLHIKFWKTFYAFRCDLDCWWRSDRLTQNQWWLRTIKINGGSIVLQVDWLSNTTNEPLSTVENRHKPAIGTVNLTPRNFSNSKIAKLKGFFRFAFNGQTCVFCTSFLVPKSLKKRHFHWNENSGCSFGGGCFDFPLKAERCSQWVYVTVSTIVFSVIPTPLYNTTSSVFFS